MIDERPDGLKAFPPWLVARDETLACAATNPLFNAFEVRRRDHRRPWFRFGKFAWRPTWGGTPAAIAIGILMVILILASIRFCGCCGLFVLIPLIGWMQIAGRRVVGGERAMPRNLTSVILGQQVSRGVLEDLWLTPASPSEWAEAIWLERRRNKMQTSVGVAMIATSLAVFGLCIGSMDSVRGFDAGYLALLVSLLVAGCFSIPAIYWGTGRSDARALLSELDLAGARKSIKELGGRLTGQLAKGCGAGLMAGLAVIAGVLGFWAAYVIGSMFLPWALESVAPLGSPVHGLVKVLKEMGGRFAMAAALLAVAFVFRAYGKSSVHWMKLQLPGELARAGAMIARIIENDLERTETESKS